MMGSLRSTRRSNGASLPKDRDPVSLTDLLDIREALVVAIVGDMPDAHRAFLISFERGEPDWSLLAVPSALTWPAVRWRQQMWPSLKSRIGKRWSPGWPKFSACNQRPVAAMTRRTQRRRLGNSARRQWETQLSHRVAVDSASSCLEIRCSASLFETHPFHHFLAINQHYRWIQLLTD